MATPEIGKNYETCGDSSVIGVTKRSTNLEREGGRVSRPVDHDSNSSCARRSTWQQSARPRPSIAVASKQRRFMPLRSANIAP